MKVYLVKRAFFSFRGEKSFDLDLAGQSCLVRMKENLGAEIVDGALPSGEKLVLYPVFPFLTPEKLAAFLSAHTGSLRFRGGFLEREGAFREGNDPDGGMFTLGDYAAMRARAFRESGMRFAARGALVEEGAQVDVCAELSRGCIVRRGCVVRGKCVLGENVVVSGDSYLEDSMIGAHTHIDSSRVFASRIGENCTVGPYASLRPATQVGNRVRLGAFVECKNACIGDGCKIAHLAYVGDADLAERVNVGCGVVFVNYDGKRKSRSSVGKNTFLGSNCNLVAPVRIGEGCFIAAGTTVTCDLANGDFCIGRSRETVKKERAKRYLG